MIVSAIQMPQQHESNIFSRNIYVNVTRLVIQPVVPSVRPFVSATLP